MTSWPPDVHVTGGELPGPLPLTIIMETAGTHATWRRSWENTHRITVTPATLAKMREKGFSALLDAVAKPRVQRSAYDSLLIDAMHWVADGERQLNVENKVTSYMTALEMFFSSPDAPITRDVSESVALLLASKAEHREKIRKLIASLYAERSKISHEGKRESSLDAVRHLRRFAVSLLARMSSLSWRFPNREAIKTWLRGLRLGVEYEDRPPDHES